MPTPVAGGAFRYPYRLHELVDPFWQHVLATVDSVHNAGEAEHDSPKAQIAAELEPQLAVLLAFLEDRDRSIEDAVLEPFATRTKWMVD